MARIRSVHPGLFTDEAFMEASPMARLLIIGLWTEAWDDGAFEWKPLVLKARIFPADGCDVRVLLDELVRLNVVKQVERGGRNWGLIRNFSRYQRPKKPNQSGIVTELDGDYLGVSITSSSSGASSDDLFHACGSEPVPNQYGTGSEKPPQMEDGGWRMNGEDEESSPPQQHIRGESEPTNGTEPAVAPSSPAPGAVPGARSSTSTEARSAAISSENPSSAVLEVRLREAAGYGSRRGAGFRDTRSIAALIAEGFDLDRDILPVIRAVAAEQGNTINSWAYFVGPIRSARSGRPVGLNRVDRGGGAGLAADFEEARRDENARRRRRNGEG